MLLRDLLSTALRGLSANRKRSFLTMLGIIIGVASVVLMVSIGRSFENYILSQIDTIGTNTIDVYPTGFEKFGSNLDGLSFDDYEQVRKLSTVESIAPVIIVGKPVQYGREEESPMIMGTTPEIFPNYGLRLGQGRLLQQSDIDGARFVAVLGSKTAEDLFGNRNPLGKNISIGGFSFTVVGVLESMGSLLLSDLDAPVFLPFSTARSISGQKYLSFMNVKAVGDVELAKQDVTSLIRQLHDIENPENDSDKDDFIARSAEQITAILSSVTLGLTIFLSLVAGISLLVGGIGIMNIMLVAVTERTREIGLRKAVGARKRDILWQFLLEAIALTLTGGAIGIVIGGSFGWLLSRLAAKALGVFDFILAPSAILLAVAMALITGLVFGIFPAKRAANLSPMEALRYE